jgi:8-oxo-dGTP pyrophosphatase MutT (NUDIX family)/GNAT superfamily N-acetyltransferase
MALPSLGVADDSAALRAAVAALRPTDARERTSIDAFVQAFDHLTDPYDEHADRVHVTASAIVTGPRGVVLHRHKRLGLWLQPGGHIDRGETAAQAALREAHEETGLPVTLAEPAEVIHVDVHPGPRGHTHLDVRFRVDAADVAPAPPSGESQDVAWFQWHRAVAVAEPGLEGVLRALQPGTPKIRPVRSNDAADCAHVYLRSRQFGVAGVPVVHPPGELRRWMADDVIGHTDTWVAELDGTIVGFVVVDGQWVEHLYLDPAWMGRGLGDQLLACALQRATGDVRLWTFQANDPARRFYERHGFVAEEFTDGAGNEERAPDVRYVLAREHR